MPERLKLDGKIFGEWVVLGFSHTNKHGASLWQCRCSCGVERSVKGSRLKKGRSQSCGCLRRHGLVKSKEYRSWRSMISRCYRKDHMHRQHYGGRGIRVYLPWIRSFKQFYIDVGPAPTQQHELHRLDNGSHYEPGNVTWVTHKENCQHRRRRKDARTVARDSASIGR
jgi:hypothetical protein